MRCGRHSVIRWIKPFSDSRIYTESETVAELMKLYQKLVEQERS